ncbi:MAG TPA: alpha/beta hydrolase [Gammaproteobacteria bacterium]|nr:alpha/beta hydrolase [Gammaproteobacteria bacterium]
MNEAFMREDVRIPSGGHALAGWRYVPSGGAAGGRYPAIVMAHGWSAVKEMYLDDYAARFARHGFVVTVFDYRGFGASEGTPRQHLDPAMQREDYKNAITWTQLQPMVDAQRIGIWGSSFSGAHVLHLGAFDRRVKAVVAQVPLINGVGNFRRLVRGDHWAALHAWIAEDRLQEARTGQLGYLPVVDEQGKPQSLPTPDSYAWFTETARTRAPSWKNENTVRSLELALEYDPGASIHLISPTPLLMLVAAQDVLTPTDLALDAYNRALEPKKLEILPGGHFDAYTTGFERSASAAADWFRRHLQ